MIINIKKYEMLEVIAAPIIPYRGIKNKFKPKFKIKLIADAKIINGG
jgi:hypothetical protein